MPLLKKQVLGVLDAPTFGFYSGYPWHVLTLEKKKKVKQESCISQLWQP